MVAAAGVLSSITGVTAAGTTAAAAMSMPQTRTATVVATSTTSRAETGMGHPGIETGTTPGGVTAGIGTWGTATAAAGCATVMAVGTVTLTHHVGAAGAATTAMGAQALVVPAVDSSRMVASATAQGALGMVGLI